jgi:mono/diheme cytochrome c family protein
LLGLCAAAVTAAGVGLAAYLAPYLEAASAPILANAEDNGTVELGKGLYGRHCASCHGRYLQGQPLWQVNDEFAGRRAPAHDASGHTWQHSDAELFHMTKYGRFAATPAGAASHMPAFRDVMSNADILAVIAFIKRRWPLGLRVSQAMLNPGQAGMPPDAARVAWRLPPTCTATARRKSSP